MIIKALLDLIYSGVMDPSAAQVAERAGVSLRTVFRHFAEMESLYRELASQMAEDVVPMVLRPFETTGWRNRLFELVERRVEIYEHVLPLKVAASLRRFRSEFLMDDYLRFLQMERAGLTAVLPEEIKSDQSLFAAIEMVTGFQAWRRMRQDQNLSVADAKHVMCITVERLVGEVPAQD